VRKPKKKWAVGSIRSIGLGLGSSALLIAAFHTGHAQSFLNTVSSCLIYPVLSIRKKVVEPAIDWAHENRTVAHLKRDLAHEQFKNKLLLSRVVVQQSTKNYASDIAETLKFKERYQTEHAQVAQVISRNLEQNDQSLLIDLGSRDGIAKDMLVIVDTMLVGKIIEVFPWYSRVQLVSDKACKVASYCPETQAQGIHVGCGDAGCTTLEHVSHLSEIKEGDLIISSGKGLVFPQGFALGSVAAVRTEGLHHLVQVKPLCDFEKLDYCLVLDRAHC
jgi:rod shape-determining protein MreC